MKKTYILLLLIVFIIPFSKADYLTTQGKNFWLTFNENLGGSNACNDTSKPLLKIVIACNKATSGTVLNPVTNISMNFSIGSGGGIDTVMVPASTAYLIGSESTSQKNKGLFIQCNDIISVSAQNIKPFSADATLVYPIEALGTDYMVISHFGDQSGNNACYKSCFSIVATADSSSIDITPTCNTQDGKTAGTMFTIILMRGETYMIKAASNTMNLTGTLIRSRDCKKIAVFAGATKSAVLNGNFTQTQDHLWEQLMPTNLWGRKFIVIPTHYATNKKRKAEMIRFVSLFSSTTVRCDGRLKVFASPGMSDTFFVTSDAVVISNKPISVCQFALTESCDKLTNPSGTDPMMMWLAPIDQMLKDLSFSIEPASSVNKCFVSVVSKTKSRNAVKFDGAIPTLNWNLVADDTLYSYAVMDSVAYGKHQLYSADGISAMVYAYGSNSSYGYQAGSSLKDERFHVSVDGVAVPDASLDTAITNVCLGIKISYTVSIFDIANISTKWLLFDGPDTIVKTGTSFTYAFKTAGVSNITVVFQRTNYGICNGQTTGTDTFYFQIRTLPKPVFQLQKNTMAVCFDSTVIVSTKNFDVNKVSNYFWTLNKKDTVLKATQMIRTVNKHSNFTFTILDNNLCYTKDSIVIDPVPFIKLPFITTPNNGVCLDSLLTVTLKNFQWQNVSSYYWTLNETDTSFQDSVFKRPLQNHSLIRLTVYDKNLCYNTDSLILDPAQPPGFSLSTHLPICSGDSFDLKPENIISKTLKAYSWFLDSKLISTDSVFRFKHKQSATIILKVYNQSNCTTSDTVNVTVMPAPDIHILSQVNYHPSNFIILSANQEFPSFQWFNGKKTMNDSFYASILGPPGKYTVWCKVTDSNACSNIDSLDIFTDKFSGLNANAKYQIQVYPNPVRNTLQVEILQNAELIIYSSDARIVLRKNMNQGHNTIDVSELSTGIYILEISGLRLVLKKE